MSSDITDHQPLSEHKAKLEFSLELASRDTVELRVHIGLATYACTNDRRKSYLCSIGDRSTWLCGVTTRGRTVHVLCGELVVFCLPTPRSRTRLVIRGRANLFRTGTPEICYSPKCDPSQGPDLDVPQTDRGSLCSSCLPFMSRLKGQWA